MNYLRHLFTPHHTNNHRAKILHNSSLLLFTLLFILLSCGSIYLRVSNPSVLGISFSITTDELLQDTNVAREENGLTDLKLNPELNAAAKAKADYMFSHNFWAHFAPDGTSPWYFIKNSGYEYLYAGENLAKGFTSSKDIVSAWMNSPSHRENLLSNKYKDIGFAVVEGNLLGEDTVLVVQMFGTPPAVAVESTPQVPVPPQKVASQENPAPESVPVPLVQKQVLKTASEQVVSHPVLNAQIVTKSATVAFLMFIIAVLILDIVIVEKNKIPRIVGHNLDHIILLLLFLTYVILTKSGGIL
ncbi:MAG: CAP domain-containing protein [Candidatus Levyibacteriota bacterium]